MPGEPAYEPARWHARLLHAVGQAVLATDLTGQIRYLNPATERLCGRGAAECIGRDLPTLLASEDHRADWADALRRVADGSSWQGESVLRDRGGRAIAVTVTATPFHDAHGRVAGLVALLADVSERQGAAAAIRQVEQLRRARFDDGAVAQVFTDLDGRLVAVNPAFCRLLERTEDDLLDRTVAELTHPDDRAETQRRTAALAADRFDRMQAEKRFVRASGSVVPVLLSVSVLRDAAGRPAAYAAFMQDLSTVKRAEEELAHLALHDALTGLPNRALLIDRVKHALLRQQREPGTLALSLVDLDDFSVLNESLGHDAGDELLRALAERLHASAHPGDTVARFGGDRFAVLCEDLGGSPREVANGLIDTVATPIVLASGEHVSLRASIGVASMSAPSASGLIAAAEAALAQAKQHERGRVVVFEEGRRRLAVDRLRLITELRDAVPRDDLRLHYQPVLRLDIDDVVGLEALVRWQHPVRGLVGPGGFVPLAEETGLISAIGEWVIYEACRTAARLAAAGQHVRVAVNLSARQLGQDDVVKSLAGALAATSTDPARMTLEVTESAVMDDADTARNVLSAIKGLGVELSIDDFGTGYSSLVYLKRFPVDEIKVDAAFVAGLGRDRDDSAIVASVVSLAKAVGVRVVAEGVETVEQLAVLRSLGCDLAQGFLWSPAVPADELPATLALLRQARPIAEGAACGPDRPPAGELDPTEARLIALHREGASLHTIAAALNSEGRRTPRGTMWRAASVAGVISEREYPALTLPTR